MKILKAKKEVADIRYLYHVIQKIEFNASEHKRYWISQYSQLEIPLPPLEIQKEIALKIEDYQKIIDGAKQIINSYKPQINIDPDWKIVDLGQVVNFKTGKLNANAAEENGIYPFFTCSKEVFKINKYSFDCEAVLLSGNNASGDFDVKYFKGKFDAYQRTYVIIPKFR